MTTPPLHWLRKNLFAKPFDIALSLIVIPATAWALYGFVHWITVDAQWSVLTDSLRVLMVGIYPPEQLWRGWFALAVLAAMFGAGLGLSIATRPLIITVTAAAIATVAGLAAGANGIATGGMVALAGLIGVAAWHLVFASRRVKRFVLPAMLFSIVAIIAVLAQPGFDVWGGLLLSVVLTLSVSILTLPFGIMLAFGRQSRIASVRLISTAYIETMRSVPLILVVYWIWILMPLLAPNTSVPSLIRGMGGYALFFAAYVAEYVRSGLQAVPRGQIEAARSLGMGTWTRNRDIVLPQALRVVVPSLVGQILDIFNGATLVFIIGLTDFLRAGQMILANPQNNGRLYEIYGFLFAVYFCIGALITYASRRLEAHLARGAK